MDPLAAIKITFFQECEEQLAELETGLLAMQEGNRDPELINAVFRAVHSMKGGAGSFGLEPFVRFAHIFETTLDEIRSGRLAADEDVVAVMLRAFDMLSDHVRSARDGTELDEERSRELAAELGAICGVSEDADEGDDMEGLDFQPVQFAFDGPLPDVPPAPAKSSWNISFKPRAALYLNGNEAGLILREVSRLGEARVTLDASSLPSLSAMDPEQAYLSWTIGLETDADEGAIREPFEFVDGDCELSITGDGAAAADGFDLAALLGSVRDGDDVPEAARPFDVAPAEPAPVTDTKNGDLIEIIDILETMKAAVAADEAAARGEAPPASAPVKALAAVSPANAQNTSPPAANSTGAPTIRVDLERVDRLIDLVGELVINQAMLAQRVVECGLARSSSVAVGLDDLEGLTREIQDSVMAIRAQPVKSVFQRMPRLVREVAAMTGKRVRLVTDGEGTEVDKTVIEKLADPITHMIRNAIDHGLESPDERVASGKPAEGVVRLAALHRSGRIVIEVSDDGRGINRERVKASAIDKGLIPSNAELTDEEIDNLIFMPGFSTAATISDISGRGVGMDVVKRSIQALGGRISISSNPGKGSTFTLSLPLTLAVLDGMVVSVCGQTLVAPLTAVIETLQPKAGEVRNLGKNGTVIAIRDAYLPVIDVGMKLGYRGQPLPPHQGVALLVEAEGGGRAALLVDAIQGQRQVVMKSLEANYKKVTGIAAATILGDGRVALILDVDAVITCRPAEFQPAEPLLAAAG